MHTRLSSRTAVAVAIIFLYAIPASALDRPGVHAKAAVLLDFDTGAVLYEKGADIPIPPASLTKLVTIYITECEASNGAFTMDTRVPISKNAWAATMPDASLMFLEPGQRVTVGELLRGLAVVSGNDAAVALAEFIAGSEKDFASLMNETMADLGFRTLHFVDASGFDGMNMVTAREFAAFCRLYIRRFPENLKRLHSVREMVYPLPENMPEGYRTLTKPIRQFNRNSLLWEDAEVDGLKTGFVNEAGYNFAVTAKRDDMRLVLVTLGGPGRNASEGSRYRSEDGIALLSYGFDGFTHYKPQEPGLLPVRIWKGAQGTLTPSIGLPPLLTIPKGSEARVSVRVRQRTEITAPVHKGDVLGELAYFDGLKQIAAFPLTASDDVKRGNAFIRAWHSIRLFVRGLSGKKVELYRDYAPVSPGV